MCEDTLPSVNEGVLFLVLRCVVVRMEPASALTYMMSVRQYDVAERVSKK